MDAPNSKGIAAPNVSNPATGLYCIAGLATTPHNVIVSAGWTGTAISAIASLGATAGCGAGTQVTVGLFDAGGNAAQNDFSVLLN